MLESMKILNNLGNEEGKPNCFSGHRFTAISSFYGGTG
jgi:hypothetical protein